MAERLRCPPHIEPRATASLVGVLESTPALELRGTETVRTELAVGDDTYALVARGAAGHQLAGARPGDCLGITGRIMLHNNVVAGKKQTLLTIDVDGVNIEWRARSNVM